MPTEYTVNQIAKSDVLCDEDFVLATDYAALEAERDSLARRINPDGAPVDVAALCLEIDTVTDERDEWKRRCEKMLTEQQRWADDACYCDFNKHGDRTLTCEYCEQVNCLQEIAEGRDNG